MEPRTGQGGGATGAMRSVSAARQAAQSRRAFLRLAAAGAADAALAACGSASGPTATSGAGAGATPITGGPTAVATATRPAVVTVAGGAVQATATTAGATVAVSMPIKRGGRIFEASVLAIPTWDVHLANTVVAGHVVCFENLLRYELVDEQAAKFELRPGLAEKWEQPDPQTIILTLRKGVTFHDGSDLNADAVKWNLERIAKDPMSNSRAQFTAFDSVEVLDASSVRIKLKTPSASFLYLISSGGGQTKGMMSKVHFEKVGATEFGRNPSGTGPFRLKTWSQDDRAVMEPFKDYWDKGMDGKPLPYADEFVARYIPISRRRR